MLLLKLYSFTASVVSNRSIPIVEEQSARRVEYADRFTLEEEIIRRHAACEEMPEELKAAQSSSGGMLHTPGPIINLDPFIQKQESTRG